MFLGDGSWHIAPWEAMIAAIYRTPTRVRLAANMRRMASASHEVAAKQKFDRSDSI